MGQRKQTLVRCELVGGRLGMKIDFDKTHTMSRTARKMTKCYREYHKAILRLRQKRNIVTEMSILRSDPLSVHG